MKKQILRTAAFMCLFALSLACFAYLNVESQRKNTVTKVYEESITAEDHLTDVRLIKEIVQKAVQFITVSRF